MSQITTGGDLLAQTLARHGVETVFCITGAGNLAIVDALARHGGFNIVYSHHEQAAVIEAQGYARIKGQIGVALVTTGGGTSNAVTGVLSANLDSVPVLVISGNESSFHCENMQSFRAFGVQGFESVEVMAPVCKSSVRVSHVAECASAVADGIALALDGRPGPVHIDIPMDLQRSPVDVADHAPSSELPPKVTAQHSADPTLPTRIQALAHALRASTRPLVYIGAGARSAGVTAALESWLTRMRLPYALSWSALDSVHGPDELNIGRIGIYGDRHANILLQQADLVVCVGTRLAIPQMGYDAGDFGRVADRWVIDIDPVELSKFQGERWHTICADLSAAVPLLISSVADDGPDTKKWLARIGEVKSALPRAEQPGADLAVPAGHVHSLRVMSYLNAALDVDAVTVTDVGAGLLTGHYALEPKDGQRLFTSQGLGEMGFGLPGAIGAYFADPQRQIICLNTDGALMFNLQELAVVQAHRIPLKLFVFNNAGYAMIRISQDNLFKGRHIGSSTATGLAFPEYPALADAFGMSFTRIDSEADFDTELAKALRSPNAEFIEIVMSPDQRYLPRLATVRLESGELISPPLEDLDPLIPLDQLRTLLGYEPTPASVQARARSGRE